MALLIDTLLPFAVFLGMVVVGLGLAVEDFRRMAPLRLAVALGVIVPTVILPLLAMGLAEVLALPPALAAGLIVLAASPPAVLTNLYVATAKASVALSVTLTALSSLLAVFTIPAVLSLALGGPSSAKIAVNLPVLPTTFRLALLLILPAALGMAVRRWRPEFAIRHGGWLRIISLTAILLPLFGVMVAQWRPSLPEVGMAVLTTALFTLTSAGMGYGVGLLSGPTPRDRFAMAMNFSTRSFGVAAVVGATFMGRTDFLGFLAAFFLTHALLATAAIFLFRTFGGQDRLVTRQAESSSSVTREPS